MLKLWNVFQELGTELMVSEINVRRTHNFTDILQSFGILITIRYGLIQLLLRKSMSTFLRNAISNRIQNIKIELPGIEKRLPAPSRELRKGYNPQNQVALPRLQVS